MTCLYRCTRHHFVPSSKRFWMSFFLRNTSTATCIKPVFALSSRTNPAASSINLRHWLLVITIWSFRWYLRFLLSSWNSVSFLSVGAICNCLLPESLKISPVGHDPNSRPEDCEKRRLRNPLSCFSSISSQRQLPPSSPFPTSPVKEPLAYSSSRKSSAPSLRNR